jgi:hypothetical protein
MRTQETQETLQMHNPYVDKDFLEYQPKEYGKRRNRHHAMSEMHAKRVAKRRLRRRLYGRS